MLESGAMTIFAADDLTGLLIEWRQGDEAALDRLTPLVYDELRRIAHRYVSASAMATRCKPPRWLTKLIFASRASRMLTGRIAHTFSR